MVRLVVLIWLLTGYAAGVSAELLGLFPAGVALGLAFGWLSPVVEHLASKEVGG